MLRRPELRTDLPGPIASILIERDSAAMSPSFTRAYPFVMDHGEGCWATDVDGNTFLDFTAGIAVCSTGHSHPRVVEAITDQARRFLHMSGTDFYYRGEIELAERLAAAMLPGAAARVFFTNSGAEAVEGAMKLARYATGRPNFLAFFGAFHGRTMGALSLTASKATQRRRFAPLLPSVFHVPYPAESRSIGSDEALANIEELFATVMPPESVAAVFVEPVQGEGGYLVPPPDFLPRLRELTRRHGILLVTDEVQSGMGRTGRMLAAEHWDVQPDVVCLAKGLASGMPLGAFVARSEHMSWAPGSHGSTFGGNPVACAAALAVLATIDNDGLLDAAKRIGERLRLGVEAMGHPLIREVRGVGLLLAVDLVEPVSAELATELREAGFLVNNVSPTAIRLAPPLILSGEQADAFLEALPAAIDRAALERAHP